MSSSYETLKRNLSRFEYKINYIKTFVRRARSCVKRRKKVWKVPPKYRVRWSEKIILYLRRSRERGARILFNKLRERFFSYFFTSNFVEANRGCLLNDILWLLLFTNILQKLLFHCTVRANPSVYKIYWWQRYSIDKAKSLIYYKIIFYMSLRLL